jgi:hypothetical protein
MLSKIRIWMLLGSFFGILLLTLHHSLDVDECNLLKYAAFSLLVQGQYCRVFAKYPLLLPSMHPVVYLLRVLLVRTETPVPYGDFNS